MTAILRYAFYAFFRVVLALRYRLHVRGREKLRGLKGPFLVLPNHPAYIDPMLVFAVLWPSLRMRPMVYAGNFKNPLFRLMAWLLNAHRVPDLDKASARAREQAERSVAAVVEGLKHGENHILWPAGHVQRTEGADHIGSARAAADILKAVPEITVVLVRTRGVWGSSFSFAQTGKKPNMFKRMLAGAGWLLANLLLFMPRRRVDMTVEPVGRDAMPEPRREALNPWLERWYNEGGPEAPTYVAYHVLGRRRFPFPDLSKLAATEAGRIKPETKTAVVHLLADKLHRPLTNEEQEPDTPLDRLGLDSLDRMEVTLEVERQFGFSSDESPLSVGQLYALAEGLAEKKPPKPPPPAWFKVPSGGSVAVLADSIPEAFVARALANPGDVILADDMAGALTYRRMLVGVLLMARRFATLPGDNVGLLLPASAACDIALLALHLAGKLPVVLNWTTGPANLAHAAEVMKLKFVVTSKVFVDRTGVKVGGGAEYLFLEQVGRGIGRFEKVAALLKVALFPGSVRKRVPRIDPERPAVVLFTSGSEKAPKAVPLTHKNIVSDQRFGIPVMELKRDDVFLGFLPAFHSFGMTVTGLLPLLSGLRVVRHPDPTDAANLARKIVAYKVTVLIGTPTFVHHILERIKPGTAPLLRLIVVGAEKCPPSVFELCARVARGATVVEGYGITECAPVVAVNPPPAPRPGSIGKAMPGIDVCAVDLESDALLPPGKMGMLLVSGPTVFPGYLDYEGPSPFVEREGKRWYVTGDLAEIDTDGYIWFRGRLKRFLKAGGEMVSLPALEEPFARLYPPTEEGPSVAIEGVEFDGGRRIVLFSTQPIGVRDANALLLEKGFQGVMRLDEVRQVDKIPVLGTGKTDYKVLRAQILESLPQPHESGRV